MTKKTTTNGFMDDLEPTTSQRKQMATAHAKKQGRPGSHKKYNVIQCRVSAEDREIIERYAKREGMSGMSQFIRKAVFDYLEKLGA